MKVYTYVNSFLVGYNSDGELPLQEGLYNVWVQAYVWGGWNLIGGSARTLRVTFPKEGTIVASLANYDLEYVFTDLITNKVISRQMVMAGTTPTLTVRSDSGGDVLVQANLKDYTLQNGNLVPQTGQMVLAYSQTIYSGQMRRVTTSATSTPQYVGTADPITQVKSAGGSLAVGPGVSERLTVTGNNTSADNAHVVAAANYIAGSIEGQTQKIVAKLQEVKNAAASGGGGGGSTDMTATNAKLDAVNDTLTASKNLAQAREDREAVAYESGVSARETMTANGTSVRTSAEAAAGARGAPVIGAVPSGDGSILQVTLPVLGTLNFDPITNPVTSSWVAFIKGVLAWVVAGIFEWWVWGEFSRLMGLTVMAPQAHGNPVVGGTGGQATALVAAGLITAAIVSVPTLFWAAADSGLTWDYGSSPLSGSPGTVVQAGIYLLNGILPMGTIVSALSSAFLVRKAGTVIFVGVATVIRFVVP